MPRYTLQAPDGRKITIEAADEATAVRGAQEWSAANPRSKLPPKAPAAGLPRARADAAMSVRKGSDRAFSQGLLFGFDDELTGAVQAGLTGVGNVVNQARGRPLAYGMKDAYRATVDAERAAGERYAEEHPVANFANGLLGGALMPVGKLGLGKSLATTAARSVGVGGALGAAYGFGNGEGGAAPRLKKAARDGLAGAAIGGAAPYVAAAGGRAIAPIARKLRGGPKPASKAEVRVARALERAAQRDPEVGGGPNLLQRVAGRAEGFMPFEAGGENLLGLAEVAAQAPGAARSRAVAALSARSQALPDRLIDHVTDATGLYPEFVAGDFAGQVDKLRAPLGPRYEALAESGPITSTHLEDLARRPSVREAMPKAIRLAREAGVDPMALGLRDVEVPPAAAALKVPPPDRDLAPALDSMRRGLKVRPSSRGPSLNQFIRKMGGIRDDMGELRARDLNRSRGGRFQAGQLANPKGRGSDDVALAAWEAGYFPEHAERPDINALFEAIDQEVGGKPRFVRAGDPERDRFAAYVEALDQRLGEAGIDLAEASDDDVRRLLNSTEDRPDLWEYGASGLPETEPAFTTEPTAATWDLVKRALDDNVEGYRDPVTRRLNLDGKGKLENDTRAALRDEVARLHPAYGELLKDAGEPLRQETAWRDAPKLMSDAVNERAFQARLSDMGPAETQALIGGWTNHLHTLARAGRLKAGQFKSPAIRSKLAAVLGRDRAGALVQQIDDLARQQQNTGQILANSATARRGMAAADLNSDPSGDALDALVDGATMNVPALTGRALKSAIKRLPRKDRSVLGDPESNRLLGESLFDDGAEMKRLLEQLQARREAETRRQELVRRFGSSLASPAARSTQAP